VWGFQAQQQRDAALRELAAAQASRSGVIDRILSEPDAKVQEVPAPGGATMLIAHSKDAQLAGVVTIGMAAPPAGKAYELWLIDAGGAAKPAGLVALGEGSTWNELPGGLGGAAVLGVTVEPAAGSAQPTTAPILLAPIT
jgi:anti-sigma-K factor RskA